MKVSVELNSIYSFYSGKEERDKSISILSADNPLTNAFQRLSGQRLKSKDYCCWLEKKNMGNPSSVTIGCSYYDFF
jgi:hypothetical protein